MVIERHAPLDPASGTSVEEQAERAVEHIRKRLGIGYLATPEDVERLVESLDKGEFDHLFEPSAAASASPLVRRQFADVKPYSDEYGRWLKTSSTTDWYGELFLRSCLGSPAPVLELLTQGRGEANNECAQTFYGKHSFAHAKLTCLPSLTKESSCPPGYANASATHRRPSPAWSQSCLSSDY